MPPLKRTYELNKNQLKKPVDTILPPCDSFPVMSNTNTTTGAGNLSAVRSPIPFGAVPAFTRSRILRQLDNARSMLFCLEENGDFNSPRHDRYVSRINALTLRLDSCHE